MKLRISGVLIVGMMLLAGAAVGQTTIVDEIVATVGSEPILRSDILDEIQPLIMNLQATTTSQEAFNRELEKIFREALDMAIDQKILYRQAQQMGMQVPDDAIEERLTMIRRQYDSEEEFNRLLQQSGETLSDFRESMRQQIMAISFGMQKRREFEQQVVVTESDMAQYFQDNRNQFVRSERVQVRRIFLGAGQDADDRSRVRTQLESLRDELVLGADFAALATRHSEGPDADNGGLVGWVQRNDLVEALEVIVFDLPEGELSEVVETDFGFHLLRVDAREGESVPTYDQVRTQIEPMLRSQRADERYRRWMDDLRRRSRVRVLI